MQVSLCGASGEYFNLPDRLKKKLKNNIVKFLLSCDIKDDQIRMDVKADDGFGLVATEACLEYVKQKGVSDYRIVFFVVYREDFEELSNETKQYYSDKIEFLKLQGGHKQGDVMHVIDYTRGWGSRNDRIDQRKTTFTNCLARHVSNAKRFITYLDRSCKRDKSLNRILDWYYSPYTDKKVIDLYAASNNIYENAEYSGVRKRKNSSMYYYRIKIKLPNGTPINIEKGSFYSPEEASEARKQHLILITTQGCDNSDKTVEDVFFEFISDTCKLKPSLEKKYLSYYNSRIKDRMGNLKIGETLNALENLYNQITHYQVKDMRTKDSSITLTPNYVSGLRAMLCNLFDYAYNRKYISSHPMYALPNKWYTDHK